MKKLIIAACLFLGFSGIASAQKMVSTAPLAKETKLKVVKKESQTAKVVKMDKATKVSKPASMTKADGTADMRFKANKEKKVITKGPLKKDGTADKRYKANKG